MCWHIHLLFQLGQVLEREIPEAPLELCEIETLGVVVTFSPFTVLNSLVTEDDWETFSICLDQHIVSIIFIYKQNNNRNICYLFHLFL